MRTDACVIAESPVGLQPENTVKENPDHLKLTLLLAGALFLVSAPAPDARDLSEMSAGFFVQDAPATLFADEKSGN